MEPSELVKIEEGSELDQIWNRFLEFEDYSYDDEKTTFTGFLTEWQNRLTGALEAGISYSETILSLKLVKNSRIDRETRSNIFNHLQSKPNYLQENLLLFTLNALNGIKNENSKFLVKSEMDDVSTLKVQLNESADNEEDNNEEEDDIDKDENYLSGGFDEHETRNPFKCSLCPMSCPRLQEFKAHEVAHEMPHRKFPCALCSASYDTQKLLEKHRLVHMDSKLKCEICAKEFFGDSSLKYHMKNVHKKNLKCEHCSKLFDRQSKLIKHMETHVKRQIAHESMFQCDQCGKEIQGKKRLRIHKRTHFLFRCQPCNKIFKDQDLLDRHIHNHREYPCDQCGQVYYQMALLQKHMNTITHGGERKFACDQCGKTFMKKYNLQTHQLTHTGEKNYRCEFEDCGMAFYKKDVMTRHMRIHTGEKPYQCDVCERRFTQSGDMKKHRRTHGIE